MKWCVVHCSGVQYCAVAYRIEQWRTVLSSIVEWSAELCRIVQYCAVVGDVLWAVLPFLANFYNLVKYFKVLCTDL